MSVKELLNQLDLFEVKTIDDMDFSFELAKNNMWLVLNGTIILASFNFKAGPEEKYKFLNHYTQDNQTILDMIEHFRCWCHNEASSPIPLL